MIFNEITKDGNIYPKGDDVKYIIKDDNLGG